MSGLFYKALTECWQCGQTCPTEMRVTSTGHPYTAYKTEEPCPYCGAYNWHSYFKPLDLPTTAEGDRR